LSHKGAIASSLKIKQLKANKTKW